MSGIVFVTITDISKTGGSGVATREIIRAIGTVADEPLYVICPEPNETLPEAVASNVSGFRYIPPETNPGEPRWHARAELGVARHLWSLLRSKTPSLVVSRLGPSTLFPAPLSRLLGVPHVLLVRGWVKRPAANDTVLDRVIGGIVRMNVRLSDQVYVAFEELNQWIQPYRGSSQSPVEILPNAVDPELFAPQSKATARESLGIDEDAFVVGFVGSPRRDKRNR